MGGTDEPCCSEPCRHAARDGDRAPFAGDAAFKRRPVDVAALRPALPQGIPGNAAILLAGEEGTRTEGLLLEWVWRTLQRGEPVVLASVDVPPSVLVDSFLAAGWNVLPFLDRGDLAILDLFTARLDDAEAFQTSSERWNSFVQHGFDAGFVEIRDPGDVHKVAAVVDDALESRQLNETGLFAVDSLTEFASFVQDGQAANFCKELRAIVSKRRYVPMLAGCSVPRREGLYTSTFPRSYEYLFDGIVDLELRDDLHPDQRIARLSVRKMNDAPRDPSWFAYEYRPGTGFVTVDPFDGQSRAPQ